ncbi:hypothetical protein GCM10011360_17380 [Primorskyibacter flagellatus]|uniref:Uncharacterized protein n=1 Tax=Primorskyibacter flagellatus TaxID=1387277 RepID=A0A917A792_9RHOB|nr:hypothetical protein GCM10011360_17380 [Primorskyibacter flagellatus]
MISRFITPILALVAAAGVIFGAWQMRRASDLSQELTTTQAELAAQKAVAEQHAEAARVHRAHLERVERENAEWELIERELRGLEGRDVPLPDALRDAASRLWP